jgi:hypothetical protein
MEAAAATSIEGLERTSVIGTTCAGGRLAARPSAR